MKLLDKNYKKYLSGMDIIGEIAIIKIKSEFLSEKIKNGCTLTIDIKLSI